MLGTEQERLQELDQMYPVWKPHTLWTLFEQSAERFVGQEFLCWEDGCVTYGQARREVNRIARGLRAIGVQPGDHVGVLLHNCPEFLYLTFALSKIGAVKIPLNPSIGRKELQFTLCLAEVTFLISEKIVDNQLLSQIPAFKKLVVLKWNPYYQTEKLIYALDFLRLADICTEDTVGMQDPNGLSDIVFTSGSTSCPKGVMCTHDMLLRSAYGTCYCRRMEVGRRLFVPIPFFHLFGYVEGVLSALFVGGTIIFSNRKFEPHHALRLMRRKRANDIICVSPVMMKLLSIGKPCPEQYPNMHAAYWASTCPDWVWDCGRESFGITDVTTGYGMTECGSTSNMLRPTDPPDYVKRCNGRMKQAGAAGGLRIGGNLLELKICDPETGRELSTGQTGEIFCRGSTVTPGYYRNESANQAAFDRNGWFHTGDLGSFDADGYLTFKGRRTDMYKINGENVSPLFLDSVIGQCPLVKAVETVGVSHPSYGEVGVAFVDLADTSEQNKRELYHFCHEHLAPFQIPKYYIFSNNVLWPRTGSGKIKKSDLRFLAQQKIAKGEVELCVCS